MPERQITGLQGKAATVVLPDSFFTHVLPRIRDLAELKLALCTYYLILRAPEPSAKSARRSVTYHELQTECQRLSPELDDQTLRQALNLALEHGILSRSTSNVNGVVQEVYSLATQVPHPTGINIFSLYEQNIGIITPIIADELKEAERLYPPEWIEEAFREAVRLNKRSWKYIARILERWASEGKDSGEYQRHTKKAGPDKYVRGRYGHLVKR